jgi:hypothetical protein
MRTETRATYGGLTPRQTRTTCYCEKCHRQFVVLHSEHEAVYQVRNRIEDAHDQAQSECHERNGITFVRLAL